MVGWVRRRTDGFLLLLSFGLDHDAYCLGTLGILIFFSCLILYKHNFDSRTKTLPPDDWSLVKRAPLPSFRLRITLIESSTAAQSMISTWLSKNVTARQGFHLSYRGEMRNENVRGQRRVKHTVGTSFRLERCMVHMLERGLSVLGTHNSRHAERNKMLDRRQHLSLLN